MTTKYNTHHGIVCSIERIHAVDYFIKYLTHITRKIYYSSFVYTVKTETKTVSHFLAKEWILGDKIPEKGDLIEIREDQYDRINYIKVILKNKIND